MFKIAFLCFADTLCDGSIYGTASRLHLEISDAHLFDIYRSIRLRYSGCDCRPRRHPVQRPEPYPLS